MSAAQLPVALQLRRIVESPRWNLTRWQQRALLRLAEELNSRPESDHEP